MHLLPVTASLAMLLAAACDRRPDINVLDQNTADTVVYATTECVTPNADRVRCDKKTCKKDDKSNCFEFATKCLGNGHGYSGTENEGTCTRVQS